jgi:hypothetical protein
MDIDITFLLRQELLQFLELQALLSMLLLLVVEEEVVETLLGVEQVDCDIMLLQIQEQHHHFQFLLVLIQLQLVMVVVVMIGMLLHQGLGVHLLLDQYPPLAVVVVGLEVLVFREKGQVDLVVEDCTHPNPQPLVELEILVDIIL